ncbi:troponin I-like isoform X2 [Stegodyphus dumicola]|uniref:troponin I-like isoform X2 n=1 Tax=Stegodyphus dumicola TaxID=202533 RepID=UPI0015B299D0|nr:troponin I-like isoform X2 [Stegodyphus dumicola]
MADEEQKRKQAEKERKKAEVRARLEAAAQAKKGGGKKGFMTPARKKKLRTLLRKKAAEELKKEQERKAEERKRTIAERCGPPKNLDGINEAELMQICKEYHDRIGKLEGEKYDMEYESRHKEYKINELNMQVNDMRGKFIKPPLKKVSRFEYGKFEKLMRAAKKADNDFRANLKSVGPSTKFKLDEDVKEAKPDWALGAKKDEKAEE